MSWNLIVAISYEVASAHNSHIHRFRNLGEKLYNHFLDSEFAYLDIDEVDKAVDTLKVYNIRRRQLKRIKEEVLHFMRQEFPEECLTLLEEKVQPN